MHFNDERLIWRTQRLKKQTILVARDETQSKTFSFCRLFHLVLVILERKKKMFLCNNCKVYRPYNDHRPRQNIGHPYTRRLCRALCARWSKSTLSRMKWNMKKMLCAKICSPDRCDRTTTTTDNENRNKKVLSWMKMLTTFLYSVYFRVRNVSASARAPATCTKRIIYTNFNIEFIVLFYRSMKFSICRSPSIALLSRILNSEYVQVQFLRRFTTQAHTRND